MKFAAVAAILAGSAMAIPAETSSHMALKALRKRALTDADILNFALTLEHLENQFYMNALAKFDQAAFDAGNYSPRLRFNIQEISRDETTHVNFLTAALKAAGATPVQACSYDFGAMPTVESFLELDSILEGVGVSAYLGAASLIMDKSYLTAAGSILTVEARHNAYIRDNLQAPGPQSPFPSPFDIPLDPMQVFTLASQFITSCPSGSNLPFTAFPALSVTKGENPAYLRNGQTINLTSAKALPASGVYCIFPAVAGPIINPMAGPFVSEATTSGMTAKCTLPAGVPGQSYVILSSSKTMSDADTLAGPAILQVEAPYVYPGFPM